MAIIILFPNWDLFLVTSAEFTLFTVVLNQAHASQSGNTLRSKRQVSNAADCAQTERELNNAIESGNQFLVNILQQTYDRECKEV